MAAEFRQYDEHGFPLPPKFSAIRYSEEAPKKPILNRRQKQMTLAVLLIAIAAIVFGPYALSAARAMVSQWFLSRAAQKMEMGDNRGALAELNRAIRWNPKDMICRLERGGIRLDMKAWQASMADFTVVIDHLKSSDDLDGQQNVEIGRREILSDAYCLRSTALTSLQRFEEAVKDANEAVRIQASASNLNARAYARALAKTDLAEALEDANKAIEQIALHHEVSASVLDTRGYVLFLLDRNEDALKDLDDAIKLCERKRDSLGNPLRLVDRDKAQRMNENLAVMYHHRGLVHEKLNHAQQAKADLKRGDDLGYNPAAGVL
jgi:tetratricopeptide (TPR) repeat protein